MEMLYSSHFARAATQLPIKPDVTLEEDCRCAMCGIPMKSNDPANHYKQGKSFTLSHALADKTSPFRCPDCDALSASDILRKYKWAVITQKKWYPISKWTHCAYFLLNPPEKPFLFIYSDGGALLQHHQIWRTPVSLSNKLFYVRFGEQLFVINHDRLMQAYEAIDPICDGLYESMTKQYKQQAGNSRRKVKKLKHPFITLDKTVSAVFHGTLRDEVYELPNQYRHYIDLLESLNSGETWALFMLVNTNEKTMPEPIIIKE